MKYVFWILLERLYELCLTDAVSFSEAQEKLWTELKAAAESGWDFSSRWYINNLGQNSGSFRDTRTSSIVPVELNALICRNERVLATFHRILGEQDIYLQIFIQYRVWHFPQSLENM